MIGKYLDQGIRSQNSGILWVVNKTGKQFQKDDGTLTSFEEAIEILNIEAQPKALEWGLAGLQVIGAQL
ncbi:MAG: hypothetical protein RRB13_15705 [bacterium]|nr:hypothetical protein [bacterium]